MEEIAEAAAVSLNAFYEHFEDKEDAFLVAYAVGHSKALASADTPTTMRRTGPHRYATGLTALFEFLATEPAFAHIALIDALTAADRTAASSNAGVDAFARMLVPGLDEAPDAAPPPPVMIEAITGGILDLCLHYAFQGRIRELPDLVPVATYVALAPFLRSAQAARMATTPPQRPAPMSAMLR